MGVQWLALGRRKTRATTWQQEPPPRFPPSWEQKSSGFHPPRLELGSASDSLAAKPLGEASVGTSGGRPRRPSARLFVLQAGRRPPSHPPPPSGPPSLPINPRGTDSRLSVPFPADQRTQILVFSPLSRPRRGPLPAGTGASTYHLPAGRPGSGTPAPWLVPRQRPGPPRRPARRSPRRRAARPRSLPIRPHQRLGPPGPRPPTATMTAGDRHGCRFPSTPSATGKENKGEEFLGARRAQKT